MAENNPSNTLEATLNASLQRQSRIREEQADQHNRLLLGKDLGRLLVVINKEVGEIELRVDEAPCTYNEYNEFVNQIHATRMTLLKTQKQWEGRSGFPVEEGVRTAIASLEITSVKLIDKIKTKLSEIGPDLKPKAGVIKVKSVRSIASQAPKATKEQPVEPLSYGARLAAAEPKMKRKIAKKRTNTASKQSSSSSTVMKLKLRTEQAALDVEEKFDKEMSERDRRKINRDARIETIRLEEEAQAQARAQEIARLKQEQELEMTRLAEAEVERVESNKRKRAVIEAKLEVLRSHDGENEQTIESNITEESEVSPDVKAAVFIGNLTGDPNLPGDTFQAETDPELILGSVISKEGITQLGHVTTNLIDDRPISLPLASGGGQLKPADNTGTHDLLSFLELPVKVPVSVSVIATTPSKPHPVLPLITSQIAEIGANPPVYSTPAVDNLYSWTSRHNEYYRLAASTPQSKGGNTPIIDFPPDNLLYRGHYEQPSTTANLASPLPVNQPYRGHYEKPSTTANQALVPPVNSPYQEHYEKPSTIANLAAALPVNHPYRGHYEKPSTTANLAPALPVNQPYGGHYKKPSTTANLAPALPVNQPYRGHYKKPSTTANPAPVPPVHPFHRGRYEEPSTTANLAPVSLTMPPYQEQFNSAAYSWEQSGAPGIPADSLHTFTASAGIPPPSTIVAPRTLFSAPTSADSLYRGHYDKPYTTANLAPTLPTTSSYQDHCRKFTTVANLVPVVSTMTSYQERCRKSVTTANLAPALSTMSLYPGQYGRSTTTTNLAPVLSTASSTMSLYPEQYRIPVTTANLALAFPTISTPIPEQLEVSEAQMGIPSRVSNNVPEYVDMAQRVCPPTRNRVDSSDLDYGRIVRHPEQTGPIVQGHMLETMCGQLALSRIPAAVPDVFDGKDPLSFPLWKISFDALTNNPVMSDTDRLNLLNRYLGGEAKAAVKGYLTLPPEEAFREAYKLLQGRYGDKFRLASGFHEQLKSWSRISGTDTVGLRRFVDFLKQCLTAKASFRSLAVLDDESENANMVRKLPTWLSRKWVRRVDAYREENEAYPSFAEFVRFLAKEDRIAHDPLARSLQKTETPRNQLRSGAFASASHNTAGTGADFGICGFCRERHHISVCDRFRNKPFDFRRRFVGENRFCYGCLNKGHQVRECRSRKDCEICRGRHPTVMHANEEPPEGTPVTASATTCASSHHTGQITRKSSMIVPVYVSHADHPEVERVVYTMLDTQSDSSFITDNTAKELGLKGKNVNLSLSTITANDKLIKCTRFGGLMVRGFNNQLKIKLPEVYSRRAIPINRDHIPCTEMIDSWPHLAPLRDQLMPRVGCEVGLLIGYDCPKALIPGDVISATGDGNAPFGMKTPLGWGIVGVISRSSEPETDLVGHSHRVATRQVTGSQIVMQNSIKAIVSPADCLKILESDFHDQKHRNEEGTSLEERSFIKVMEEGIMVDDEQYSMPLPFNHNKKKLFNNKTLVANRTMSLKRKLERDSAYSQEYTQFVEDMIRKGFAEEVHDSDEVINQPAWYLPHFGVFHKTKGKIRVVFDCSARYQGISLNDALLKGPDYINSLVGILCRFRKHPVAFNCDIEKMFYAFRVHPEDRDYLRFLWWKGGDTRQPLSTFRMTAHLFGAVSSPACATYGLRHITKEFTEYGEDVLEFISRDFYVDDGLKSVCGEDTAISLVKRTVDLCKARGVRLHKFSSNSARLLNSLPESECAAGSNLLNLAPEEYPTERVLGVLWDIRTDTFRFKVNANRAPVTKREILSVTSGIFDPLGWISPFTLKARKILQQICRDKLDWDEKVPQSMLNNWIAWYQGTATLHQLAITRCWQNENYDDLKQIQLHHFADASENGYGACSYLRTVNSANQVSVHLVMAKARVTPIASMTIPRLELMAAVVAARLSVILDRELHVEREIHHHFWTDSRVVLGYLRNDARRFKIFVANRIQEIHDVSSPSQWRHVSGRDNPADLASRGMKSEDLVKSSLWFYGPSFLQQEILSLKETECDNINDDDQELRKVISHAVTVNTELDTFNFSLFSTWRSLTRGVARARLLAKQFKLGLSIKGRLRSSTKQLTMEPLRVSDFQTAEQLIVKAIQQSYFSEEIATLNSKETLQGKSDLYRLDCFVDKNGLLRVGGRLRFTSLYSAYKHPVVLPKGAHVSELLIQDCHQYIKHQGRGMTINEVRARGYWVIGLNGLVKNLIRKCVTCQALRGAVQGQKMADLPADRAECAPPFTYCGVDIFGPFCVKERRSELKRYGAIFTCLTTRAIHIEMTYALTTDAFIQALRKFVAIRGPIRLLRCDNGTNFVGANKELERSFKSIQSAELKKFAIDNHCDLEFRTNPPSASHMGGAWERLIRVVRSVLSAILDAHSTRLDDCSLGTFLYEVAAVVNTRPLSLEHITDPNHPEPLTPNHLLTGKSRVVLPPPGEFDQGDAYSIKRWRCVQFLTDQFWKRWRGEYLQYLQLRSKWQREKREMRVGDIALISEANAPRNSWKRGVVTEVFVSHDGLVRSVKLRTGRREDGADNTLVRPVHKLVLLLPGAEELSSKAALKQ